ncbi:MAG: TetR/AcrR family transcriptional regulator [Bryobacteraceae bacterium]
MARTRSASAHQKVIKAALDLVSEQGVNATSMDAIARKSGVSKATIYNHWSDKDALLLDLMAEVHALHARPKFDSGNIQADMAAVLGYRPPDATGLREPIMVHFMAYSATNAAFGMAWRDLVMEQPRRELRRLLTSGIQKGELSRDLNVDLALALLLGPMIYWHVFLKRTGGDPVQLATDVLDSFWKAYGISRRGAPARFAPSTVKLQDNPRPPLRRK